MQFSAITTFLSIAALAIAAPTVEVRGEAGGVDDAFSGNCQQAGGDAYCCDQATPANSLSSVLPIDLTVVVECFSILLGAPICGTSTVCCTEAPHTDTSLINILGDAQVCPSIAL